MQTKDILSSIDAEIARLREARAILTGSSDSTPKRGPGRPPNGAEKTAPKAGKRVLSPEARERIAAAQRKRWAAVKKAANK
jgi:hypothetical protein